LNYLPAFTLPKTIDDCEIQSTIYFTEYGFANLYPTVRVSRHTTVMARSSFKMSALDEYVKTQGWQGDTLDNLTDVLDSVIDGRIDKPVDPSLGAH
jgi:hypothetical protein